MRPGAGLLEGVCGGESAQTGFLPHYQPARRWEVFFSVGRRVGAQGAPVPSASSASETSGPLGGVVNLIAVQQGELGLSQVADGAGKGYQPDRRPIAELQ